MNSEQSAYISSIGDSVPEEIFIKKTGWEEVNLSVHSHGKHQIVYTLSGTLHVRIGSDSYFVPEKHIAWIPKGEAHELSSKNRQVSLVIYYIDWGRGCVRNSVYKDIFHLFYEYGHCRKFAVHRFSGTQDLAYGIT